MALISGEAGIGKTTLANTIMGEAAEQDALLLSGRCFDLTATPPYGPWAELLSGSPDEASQPPISMPPQYGGEPREAPNPDALFIQFMEFLDMLTRRQPVVMLLDDIHWADTASLDLLRYLARHIGALPVLLLVTYRTEEVTRRHLLYTMLPSLVREAGARRIELRRLDDVAMEDWINRRYRLSEPDAHRLASYLQQHAEGNPFFAGELLRALEDDEALYVDGDEWKLDSLQNIRIPLLLRQVIEGRLARVGDQTRQLLSLAAIIGEAIDVGLWQRVADVDEETLLEALEDAAEAGLLITSSDGLTVRFDHALVRETLYEAIYPLRRRLWHRQIAEILAEVPAPDAEAAAFHYRQASDARAGEWLVKAGDQARDAHALSTAFERYEAALQIFETSGAGAAERGWLLLRLADTRVWLDEQQGLNYLEEAKRIADETGDTALSVAILWHRGKLRTMAGDNGLPDLETSISLLRSLGPDEREAVSGHLERGYLAETGEAIVVRMLASYYAHFGRYQDSLDLAEQLLTETPHDGDEELYEALGLSYSALGRPDEARWAFAQARDIVRHSHRFADLANITRMELRDAVLVYHADRLGEREQLANEIEQTYQRSIAHGTVSNVPPRWGILPLLFLEGYWEECIAITREALERGGIWQRTAAPVRGPIARHQGDRQLAWSLIREAFPLGPATDPATQYFDSELHVQRLAIELALDEEDAENAHSWLVAHEQWLTESGRIQGWAEFALLKARYHLVLGDSENARTHAGNALRRAGEPRQPLALLAARRLLGELDTRALRYDGAAEHLDEALRIAESCAAPYERALTLLARCRLYHERGQASLARQDQEEVHSILSVLGARPALRELELLHGLIPEVNYTVSLEGLTDREVEVLQLVASGLTDAEVALRLGISPRTVSNHLGSIYTKLNVASRTAATRLAIEREII